MKRALVLFYDMAEAEGLDFYLVGNIHDEIQVEAREDHSERVGELLVQGMIKAGEYFDLRCPLDGEFKVGNSWAETH